MATTTPKAKRPAPEALPEPLAQALAARRAKEAEVTELTQKLAAIESDPSQSTLTEVRQIRDQLKPAAAELAELRHAADLLIVEHERTRTAGLAEQVRAARLAVTQAEEEVDAAKKVASDAWRQLNRLRGRLDVSKAETRAAERRLNEFHRASMSDALADARRSARGLTA